MGDPSVRSTPIRARVEALFDEFGPDLIPLDQDDRTHDLVEKRALMMAARGGPVIG